VGGQCHDSAALLPGKNRYPFYRKLGEPQGRNGPVRNISPPTGIPSPDRPARSFPGPQRIKHIHPNDIQRDVCNHNFVGWFVLVRNIILYFEGKKNKFRLFRKKITRTRICLHVTMTKWRGSASDRLLGLWVRIPLGA